MDMVAFSSICPLRLMVIFFVFAVFDFVHFVFVY